MIIHNIMYVPGPVWGPTATHGYATESANWGCQ